MAKWHPVSDSPVAPDWFVKALKEIDPEMRVVWGMDRYLNAQWAIERKMEAEKYWLAYESILSSNEDRFIDQPIFDVSQPVYDDITGDIISYKQIGSRKFDLAPEYEHIAFRKTLDQGLLDHLKKLCWQHDHPEETAKADQEEKETRAAAQKAKRIAGAMEGVDEAFKETRKEVVFGYGKTRNEEK
jgi:hypothetical protein